MHGYENISILAAPKEYSSIQVIRCPLKRLSDPACHFDYKNDQNGMDNCRKNRTILSPKINNYNQENTDMFT